MIDKAKQSETEEGFDFKQFEKILLKFSRRSGKPVASVGHGLVKELTKRTALLDAKMEEHLGYEKHDLAGHGRGTTRIKGDFGEVEINPPRDREGTFEPALIKKRSGSVGNFTKKIISLYARGMTTREIAAHIKEEVDE